VAAAELAGATLALWRDVAVPLRGGTITRADIWRPVAGESPAVVLKRTPCNKERAVPSAVLDPPRRTPRASPCSYRTCAAPAPPTATSRARQRALGKELGPRRHLSDRFDAGSGLGPTCEVRAGGRCGLLRRNACSRHSLCRSRQARAAAGVGAQREASRRTCRAARCPSLLARAGNTCTELGRTVSSVADALGVDALEPR
jgi:hypothetical protein